MNATATPVVHDVERYQRFVRIVGSTTLADGGILAARQQGIDNNVVTIGGKTLLATPIVVPHLVPLNNIVEREARAVNAHQL